MLMLIVWIGSALRSSRSEKAPQKDSWLMVTSAKPAAHPGLFLRQLWNRPKVILYLINLCAEFCYTLLSIVSCSTHCLNEVWGIFTEKNTLLPLLNVSEQGISMILNIIKEHNLHGVILTRGFKILDEIHVI